MYQEIGFGAAVVLWVALLAGGVVAEDVGTEALWFLIAGNGAALAFLIGWAHLAPEVDGAKQRYPLLAWTVVGVSLAIVLGTTAWTFSPSPIDSPLAISYPIAAAIFYPLAAAVAALKLWLYTRRDERTL